MGCAIGSHGAVMASQLRPTSPVCVSGSAHRGSVASLRSFEVAGMLRPYAGKASFIGI
jgi:hypothetical protein